MRKFCMLYQNNLPLTSQVLPKRMFIDGLSHLFFSFFFKLQMQKKRVTIIYEKQNVDMHLSPKTGMPVFISTCLVVFLIS